MGILQSFVFLPLTILMISAIVGGGATLTGNCGTNGDSQQCLQSFDSGAVSTAGLTTYDCSAFTFSLFGGTPCFFALPESALITCSTSNANGCYILSTCPANFQASGGLFCNAALNKLIESAGGRAIILNGQGSGNVAYASPFAIIFGSIGNSGFLPWIAVAVGAAVIASISFLGTGLEIEGVRLLFLNGLLLGVWAFMSGLEGFLTGSPNSFFVGMNTLVSGLGTIFYVGLTLVYTVGCLGVSSVVSG